MIIFIVVLGVFFSGVLFGMEIERARGIIEEIEEIEEKPLVSYKERRKIYRQIHWKIDD